MAKNKISTVPYRRKRQGKTNYKKRLTLLKGKKPRLIVRKTNKNIISQIVLFSQNGDKVEAQSNSKELEKFGWKYSKSNTPSAYLTGLLLGKKSGKKEAILDIGLQKSSKDSKLFACLKGCIDAGIIIPHSDENLPSEERMRGEHISSNIPRSKEIAKSFEEVKKKILGGK